MYNSAELPNMVRFPHGMLPKTEKYTSTFQPEQYTQHIVYCVMHNVQQKI